MKLKNKKTGEIGTLIVDGAYSFVTNFAVEDDKRNRLGEYNSLTELNAEWEDYEEPKEYWYINEYGTVTMGEKYGRYTIYDKSKKNFGNYFDTKEEAEKAVERLRAWKRLKENGFSFHGYDDGYNHDFNSGHIEFYIKNNGDVLADLDLLFGGEE